MPAPFCASLAPTHFDCHIYSRFPLWVIIDDFSEGRRVADVRFDPYTTRYNRFVRWRPSATLAGEGGATALAIRWSDSLTGSNNAVG
jgi:hypothetical protein